MSQTSVVDALVALGFNLNEGRAYTALLRLGPSTGYEVSQRAGVPRSAVYATLRRLVDAGAARSLAGNPEKFMATPPDALLELLRDRFEVSRKGLEEAIAELDVKPVVPDAFSVRGYERVLEEAVRVVRSARETLVISGWPREVERMLEPLLERHRAGAYIVLFSHAALSQKLPGLHFSYGLEQTGLEEFWEHRLVVVADDRRSLIAATEEDERDTAVLSEAAPIAEFAVGQVALDITLLAQRHAFDVSDVMARILGDRVGRLDELLAERPPPTLGLAPVAAKPPPKRKSKKASRG